MHPKLRRPGRILAGSVSAILLIANAHADTWDGGGGDNLFGTGANWLSEVAPVPSPTTDLNFAGSTQLTPNNNYAAFDDFHSITFDATAGAFVLSGNAIDLFGKIENYSAVAQTVGFDLAVTGGQSGTGEFNPVNGDLVINSANVFTNGNTLHVYGVNNKTVTFGAGTVISQGGGFNVEQASNVVFLGANTYTGATNVLAGSLTIGNGGATGQMGTGTATVSSGAKLTFNRSDNISVANVLAGGGDYVKAGAGTLTLTGANTLSGMLTISAGTVNVGTNASALGTAAIVLGDANTGANNVALISNGASVSRPITVSANGSGTATIGTVSAGTGGITFSGQLTLNRPTTLTSGTTDRTTFSGKITGNVGTLTFAGGLRTVIDNLANDFVGDIVVTGANTILQTGVGTGTEHIPNGSSVDIGTGAIVKLAGTSGSVETINALNGTGVIRRHEAVGGVQTLVIGSAGGTGTFGGTLLNGSGTLAIRKEGAGTQTITSAAGNTASGGITVNGGVLKFSGVAGFDGGTFSTAQTYNVNNGGTLEIAGDWLTKSTSTYNINAGGTLTFSSPGISVAGNRTLNYVNNLNLTDGTVNGPSFYRVGNNTTATHNFSGNLGNTINSGFAMIKNTASQTVVLNVADGTADADLTVNGVIFDDAALTGSTLSKAGAGKLILTATNTYLGPTSITAGTLQIGAGGTSGTFGAGAITNNAALVFNRSNALSMANAISGTGTVTHAGTGTTTLTGALSYSGATSVNAGTLISTPSQTGATTVTVSDGATFGVKLLNAGTTFSADSVTTGTSSGATLLFDTGAFGNPSAPIMNAATLTPNALTTLRVTGSNLAAGTFTLLDYGTLGGLSVAGFTLSLPFRVGGTLANNPGNTSLDVTISGAETLKWQGNVAGGNWDIDPDGGNTTGTLNWKTSMLGTSARYAQGTVNTDVVTFDDTATGTTNVNLTTALSPISLTVNNSSLPYTFAGTGKISGATGLIKQGTEVLTLANSGANDFTGPVSIEEGAISIATMNDAGSAGPLGQSSTPVTLGATGTLGELHYTGPTASSSKPLTLASGGAGALQVDNANAVLTMSGAITGGGIFLKSGPGAVLLTAANSYGGETVVRSGILEGRTNTAFGSGAITLADSGTGASNLALYLGNRADISNAITVSADGTGTVTIGASNTGSGANASIISGIVTLNRPTTLSGEIVGDRLALDGRVTGNVGILTIAGGGRTTFANTTNDFVGDIVITGNGTILQASVATAAEVIPDATNVIVNTGAVFQLASTSGAETINGLNGSGTVRTFISGTYGSGLVVGSAGGSGNFSGSLQNGTAGNPLSLTKAGAGIQELTGTNTYTGTTTIAAGTLALTGSGSIANSSVINVQLSGTLDVSGVALGYVVAPGQTLKGLGAVHGATTISGILAPGDSVGILNFNDALSFNSTAQLAFELGAAVPGQYDSIAGVTNLTLDGTFTVSLFGGFIPEMGNHFDLLDWSGTFDSTGFNLATDLVLPGLGGELSWDTSNFLVDGTLAVVPEPSVALSLISGVGLLITRRRRQG